MSAISWLQPRDHAVAARTVSVLCVVAAVVTIVVAVADPRSSVITIAIAVPMAAAVILAGWLMRYLRPSHEIAWACSPLIAVAVIAALDVLTSDGSVAAQVFFFFPALYGASQLRPRGAIVVGALTIVGELVVVAVELPGRTALIDATYVCAALLTTMVLLMTSGQRQEELVIALKRQAAIDPLTGLATRRVLDHAAQSALSGAASGEGSGLIVLDVDDFKAINDQFGHPGGDEVLIALAKLLKAGCRDNDIVSRLGGDEIALLLPGCSPEALARRADQIIWDVRAHAFILSDGQPVSISVSAGIAHAPTDALDLRSLYAAADAVLYDAKRAGRNRVGRTPVAASQHLTPNARTSVSP